MNAKKSLEDNGSITVQEEEVEVVVTSEEAVAPPEEFQTSVEPVVPVKPQQKSAAVVTEAKNPTAKKTTVARKAGKSTSIKVASEGKRGKKKAKSSGSPVLTAVEKVLARDNAGRAKKVAQITKYLTQAANSLNSGAEALKELLQEA